MTIQTTIEVANKDLVPLLFGEHNSHLHHLEKKLGISIADRGNQLTFSGDADAIKKARYVLDDLMDKLKKNRDVGIAEIDAALRFFNAPGERQDVEGKPRGSGDGKTIITTKKKTIAPRTPNQAAYIKAIKDYEMVFGIGPAGTGKTFLAVAAGVEMFLEGDVERLIFCRPAVEAGENLGFLPGDMKEKVDPYLRPIYDALQDTLHSDYMQKKMETGHIEIAPLAFMRGRTLANAFVVLDEAQNATCGQMKMFLTRMGESSRMVITGDLSQSDLPRGVKSGLLEAKEILEDVSDIKFMYFNSDDVVRHHLVGKIIKAYDART